MPGQVIGCPWILSSGSAATDYSHSTDPSWTDHTLDVGLWAFEDATRVCGLMRRRRRRVDSIFEGCWPPPPVN